MLCACVSRGHAPVCLCVCVRFEGRGEEEKCFSTLPLSQGRRGGEAATITIYCHHLSPPLPPPPLLIVFPLSSQEPQMSFFFLHFLFLGGGCLVCILGCADFCFSCNAKRNRTNIGRRLAWLFVFAPLFAGIQRRSNEKRHFVELIFFIPCSRFEVPPFRLLHTSLSSGKANAHLWLLLSFPFHASCVT